MAYVRGSARKDAALASCATRAFCRYRCMGADMCSDKRAGARVGMGTAAVLAGLAIRMHGALVALRAPLDVHDLYARPYTCPRAPCACRTCGTAAFAEIVLAGFASQAFLFSLAHSVPVYRHVGRHKLSYENACSEAWVPPQCLQASRSACTVPLLHFAHHLTSSGIAPRLRTFSVILMSCCHYQKGHKTATQ